MDMWGMEKMEIGKQRQLRKYLAVLTGAWRARRVMVAGNMTGEAD